MYYFSTSVLFDMQTRASMFGQSVISIISNEVSPLESLCSFSIFQISTVKLSFVSLGFASTILWRLGRFDLP